MDILEKEKKKVECRRRIIHDYCPHIMELTGVEIGPLCYPTLDKNESHISYLDICSKETLAQSLGRDYPLEVVDVDIVTNGRPLVGVLPPASCDYFIANHVLEHIPNLISWFEDIHSLLKPGGFIYLAIPDRKFTFDLRRPETSCGHLIVDYENGMNVDSAEHNLDSLIYHETKPEINWDSICAGRYDFIHHHHVFNADDFTDRIIRPLVRLRYLKFSLMRCETAPELYNEFVVILRKEERSEDITILGEAAELQAGEARGKSRFIRNMPSGNNRAEGNHLGQLAAIAASAMFQPSWYLDKYPEVRMAGIDPLRHYFFSGWRMGYNPSPDFDGAWYLRNNPDVAGAGYNPLWHYVVCGKGEGRKPKE